MPYTADQRREYLHMMDRVGRVWMDLFDNDPVFYSAVYWDLLTELWRANGPVRKTEALRLMQAIRSPHTAGKYLDEAVRRGVVEEWDNPDDQRSRLVALSATARSKLDSFLDAAAGEVCAASRLIGEKGTVSAAD